MRIALFITCFNDTLFPQDIVNLFVEIKTVDELRKEKVVKSTEKRGGIGSYTICLTPITSFQI